MGFIKSISNFFSKYLFNYRWRCLACGKEIFEQDSFCEECKKSLPYNEGAKCDFCGRKLKISQKYCTTCKGRLVNIDKARSLYVYKKPIDKIIQKLKYSQGSYLAEPLAEELAFMYFKSYLNVDAVAYVPMYKKDERKRGYNQSLLLAEKFAERTGLELIHCLEKTKHTERQATLSREQRQKNLLQSFIVVNRGLIKGKKIVLVDDVSTTGTTGEVIAERLKKAHAQAVYLLTIASVSPKDGY